jgi:hypothetical protein
LLYDDVAEFVVFFLKKRLDRLKCSSETKRNIDERRRISLSWVFIPLKQERSAVGAYTWSSGLKIPVKQPLVDA